jgi:phospholipid/cholesterol/gamma-HCH transport system permease protein
MTPALEATETLVEFLRFAVRAIRVQFTRAPPRQQFLEQAVSSGIGSLGLVTVLIFFGAMGLTVQGFTAFQRFGGQSVLGLFIGIGGVRELYPVLSGVVVGARVGANFAASLANRQISEQVEALEVMGVDPFHYFVAPRLWALTLTLPLLCAYAISVGLASSYFAAVEQLGMNSGNFFNQLSQSVGLSDLAAGVLKGVIFGWLVALISCFYGYRAKKRDGAEGVGMATNRAIVVSSVTCIVVNMLITAVMYS